VARRTSSVILGIAAALLAGCSIGPKYIRPSAPVPVSYKETGAADAASEWKTAEPRDDALRGAWWAAFHDPDLDLLEEKLNQSNQNVAAAAANVQAAKAMVREARAQYFPALTANPAIATNRISSAFGQTVGATFTTYSLPLEASWELDLWGRVRKTVESATFAAQAGVADLESVRLSAQAELASDYYQLRSQDALKQLLDATVKIDLDALDLTRTLYVSGLANDEAVAQAEAQLRAAQAQDTNLGVLRAQYEHALALLDGEPASTFALPPKEFEAGVPEIPPGVPSQLLERRPDIAASERAVAQANAQIGIAKTAFFPNLTLNASAGLGGVSFLKWFEWPSRVWSVGPTLAQTVFDGGARKAVVQQSQAAYDQTVANYRQTVLTAFQQVEDNLAALRVLTEAIEEQDAAIAAAGRNLDEAEVRYKSGLDPYLNVIAAQAIVLNDQQAAVNFRAQRMVASVQLIKALGGGWDASQIPSAKQLSEGVHHEPAAKR